MEERKLGVLFAFENDLKVTKYLKDEAYDYIVLWSEKLWNNGNGWRKMEVFDSSGNLSNVERNCWILEHDVMAIFNWAGTSIGANIVDPNGVKRRIRHDAYDANIFNGIIYRKDVESIFTVFEKYFKYKDWKDFDYRTSNCKDRFSIPSFYEELLTK